jgi:hypothetical protein
MAEAKRTDPQLWERVKREVTDSDKGGAPGQWSARKAQMAVQEYKRRGGGYQEAGPSQEETDLHRWTAEEWGTKSGEDSLDSGERYLPKRVRMLLTEDEYRRSTAKKRRDTGGKGEQFSSQPKDVREKVAHIERHGATRAMLEARARELGIEGRSRMSGDALLRAIDAATDENGRKPGAPTGLSDLTKAELYARARKAGIAGRSRMSKDELTVALAHADAR